MNSAQPETEAGSVDKLEQLQCEMVRSLNHSQQTFTQLQLELVRRSACILQPSEKIRLDEQTRRIASLELEVEEYKRIAEEYKTALENATSQLTKSQQVSRKQAEENAILKEKVTQLEKAMQSKLSHSQSLKRRRAAPGSPELEALEGTRHYYGQCGCDPKTWNPTAACKDNHKQDLKSDAPQTQSLPSNPIHFYSTRLQKKNSVRKIE